MYLEESFKFIQSSHSHDHSRPLYVILLAQVYTEEIIRIIYLFVFLFLVTKEILETFESEIIEFIIRSAKRLLVFVVYTNLMLTNVSGYCTVCD